MSAAVWTTTRPGWPIIRTHRRVTCQSCAPFFSVCNNSISDAVSNYRRQRGLLGGNEFQSPLTPQSICQWLHLHLQQLLRAAGIKLHLCKSASNVCARKWQSVSDRKEGQQYEELKLKTATSYRFKTFKHIEINADADILPKLARLHLPTCHLHWGRSSITKLFFFNVLCKSCGEITQAQSPAFVRDGKPFQRDYDALDLLSFSFLLKPRYQLSVRQAQVWLDSLPYPQPPPTPPIPPSENGWNSLLWPLCLCYSQLEGNRMT